MTQRNPHPFEPQDDAALSQLTSISVKGLRISKDFSQEGHCFQATVYLNNKRAFIAHNDGNGGANYYTAPGVTKDSDAKRLTFNRFMTASRLEACRYISEKGEDYESFIETYSDNNELIDWVITDLINEKEMLKKMRADLKSKIVVYDQRTRLTTKWELSPIERNIDPLKKFYEVIAEKNEWVWLNEITEHEALKIWRHAK